MHPQVTRTTSSPSILLEKAKMYFEPTNLDKADPQQVMTQLSICSAKIKRHLTVCLLVDREKYTNLKIKMDSAYIDLKTNTLEKVKAKIVEIYHIIVSNSNFKNSKEEVEKHKESDKKIARALIKKAVPTSPLPPHPYSARSNTGLSARFSGRTPTNEKVKEKKAPLTKESVSKINVEDPQAIFDMYKSQVTEAIALFSTQEQAALKKATETLKVNVISPNFTDLYVREKNKLTVACFEYHTRKNNLDLAFKQICLIEKDDNLRNQLIVSYLIKWIRSSNSLDQEFAKIIAKFSLSVLAIDVICHELIEALLAAGQMSQASVILPWIKEKSKKDQVQVKIEKCLAFKAAQVEQDEKFQTFSIDDANTNGVPISPTANIKVITAKVNADIDELQMLALGNPKKEKQFEQILAILGMVNDHKTYFAPTTVPDSPIKSVRAATAAASS